MENSPSIGSFSTFDATKLSGPELDCLKEAFALFDADHDAIDFNEFIEMMLRRDSKIEEDVVHAFRVFDRDGDGLISKEELKLTMNNLGEPLTDAEVKAMIEEADMDGDGRINFQEFSRLMQSQQGGGGGPSKSNGRDLVNPSIEKYSFHRLSIKTYLPKPDNNNFFSGNNPNNKKHEQQHFHGHKLSQIFRAGHEMPPKLRFQKPST
ncbi:CALM [Lepeophtheirus salmonis]|uniref:CALM n=1 Tax=Lepeophtheirus salmonis TaxID=72036 RepID=A0A7R8CXU2_LEPSM|nr:CALM [Lepeophtheirus salmonis]CAF2964952.1 CALM [Lepeophtheirus salmonis]